MYLFTYIYTHTLAVAVKSCGEELTALATAKKVIEEATGGAEGQVCNIYIYICYYQ